MYFNKTDAPFHSQRGLHLLMVLKITERLVSLTCIKKLFRPICHLQTMIIEMMERYTFYLGAVVINRSLLAMPV